LAAFGRLFIANPDLDLVERSRIGAALYPYDRSTFYGGNEHGYIDYPFLDSGVTPVDPAFYDARDTA
jgi:N-ethylmaleimide reductase